MPLRPPEEPPAGVLVVGPIAREDVAAQCERLRALVREQRLEAVACDVAALVADAVAIEALARLQLTARRIGCRVRLRTATQELRALLDLCGLRDVLPSEELCGGRRRQPEEREDARGVEEGVQPGDPPA